MAEPRWWVHPNDGIWDDDEFPHNKKDALKVVDKMLNKHNGVVIQRNPFTTIIHG